MMYLQQGAAQKKVRVFTKRGLSWVSVGHRDTWGKLDGVWRRGTAEDILVVLDPPVQTLYWDYNLWELLGQPADELNVQILVGKNAVLCGSLHPSDPKPALDLAGGWALTTKFEVFLHGMLVGASGWSGEPPLLRPDLLPINGRETAGNHAAVCNTSNALVDYGRNSGTTVGMFPPQGNIYGQFFAGLKGGRGGDCLRTNRPTKLHIMEGPDYIGMVLPGGGGGASLAAYWRRFVGKMRMYVDPNVGGLSGTYSVLDKYKQWSFAGWGGSIGSGATSRFGLAGPAGHPYSYDARVDVSPFSPDSEAVNTCFAHGRAVRPFNRDGMFAGNSGDGYSNYSQATHPARNISGRSASSGHARGSDVFMGTQSEIVSSGRVLANDIRAIYPGTFLPSSLQQGALSVADFNKIKARLEPFHVRPRPRIMELYDRRDFRGGVLSSPEYAFDTLQRHIITAGQGGTPGGSGTSGGFSVFPVPAPDGSSAQSTVTSKAWNDSSVFGFSAFYPTNLGTGAPWSDAGRAVVGSEYVTVIGRKIERYGLNAYNWAGASVPFE